MSIKSCDSNESVRSASRCEGEGWKKGKGLGPIAVWYVLACRGMLAIGNGSERRCARLRDKAMKNWLPGLEIALLVVDPLVFSESIMLVHSFTCSIHPYGNDSAFSWPVV